MITRQRVFGWAAIGAIMATSLVAGSASADERLGVSACAFLQGPPQAKHPVRKGPFRGAFSAQASAKLDPIRNTRALNAFVATADRLMTEGARAFALKHEDPTDFNVSTAQRFLSTYVLTPNASLRVGRDGFELAPEVTAAAMLAGCLGSDKTSAIALARRSTGPDSGSVRAGAALLVLFQDAGTAGDAAALADGLTPDDFLSAFVLAELASRGQDVDKALAAHKHAAALVKTADQYEAITRQAQRLPERP